MNKPKRPRDTSQLAHLVIQIATGEVADVGLEKPSARKAASSKGGVKGGKTRMDALSKEERVRLAQSAAAARWNREAPAKTDAPVKRSVKRER